MYSLTAQTCYSTTTTTTHSNNPVADIACINPVLNNLDHHHLTQIGS
jgi:hypothetical protein